MNIEESKLLAEKLTGQEVLIETIEGIYLEKDELPEEISKFLKDGEEEYLIYINPVEGERTVNHVLGDNEEIIISFMLNEEGEVEEIYEIEGME